MKCIHAKMSLQCPFVQRSGAVQRTGPILYPLEKTSAWSAEAHWSSALWLQLEKEKKGLIALKTAVILASVVARARGRGCLCSFEGKYIVSDYRDANLTMDHDPAVELNTYLQNYPTGNLTPQFHWVMYQEGQDHNAVHVATAMCAFHTTKWDERLTNLFLFSSSPR